MLGSAIQTTDGSYPPTGWVDDDGGAIPMHIDWLGYVGAMPI